MGAVVRHRDGYVDAGLLAREGTAIPLILLPIGPTQCTGWQQREFAETGSEDWTGLGTIPKQPVYSVLFRQKYDRDRVHRARWRLRPIQSAEFMGYLLHEWPVVAELDGTVEYLPDPCLVEAGID